MHMCMHVIVLVYVYAFVCVSACTHVGMNKYIYTCICGLICAYMCVHIHMCNV